MGKYINEQNNQYDRLYVICDTGRSKSGKVLWLCLCNCGNYTIVCGSDLRNGQSRSCGCLQKERVSKMAKQPKLEQHKQKISENHADVSKEKNPNWKGGISTQNELSRQWFTKYISPKVFERDDWTCQLCGVRIGPLNAHHILWWSLFPLFRFELWNCITLCANCHREVHWGNHSQ